VRHALTSVASDAVGLVMLITAALVWWRAAA
jgi:hypothetical protein